MIKYKKGMIASLNLFFLLFVSRTIIGFTVSSEALKSRYSMDLVYSTFFALLITFLISLPAVICAAKGKSVMNHRFLRVLYGVYFIFSGAVNVAKFAVFSSTELNQNAKIAVLAGFMILACTYAASLGIEAVSRFGSMVFVITLIGAVGVMAEGASDFSYLNLFPITQNPGESVLGNILFSVCSTNELVLFIALAPKVNGKTAKPFYFSLSAAYLVMMVLIAFTIGVLGDTASLSAYPLFEVSQLSKLGSGERLEAIFTALWIFAVFLKITLFLYCAGESFSFKKKWVKFSFCGAAMFALSAFFLYGSVFDSNQEKILYPAFAVFAFVLPLLYLIFGRKRNKIEEVNSHI